jgi:uncharacterized protein YecA (UPF0149 family)
MQETAMVKEVTSERKEDRKKVKEEESKLGRNDPCWCGSGKKWKRCHYPQTQN